MVFLLESWFCVCFFFLSFFLGQNMWQTAKSRRTEAAGASKIHALQWRAAHSASSKSKL
jgi:hypothetical protein